jgi:hypothetical protein
VNVQFAEIASVVLEILKNYNIVQKIMSNRQRIQRYKLRWHLARQFTRGKK